MKRDSVISFDALVERIAPEVPRFVVYPGRAWDETETFVVEVRLNGVAIGLRSLIPWKERGWHFNLAEPMCRKAGVETGSPVHVEMKRVRDPRPAELVALMEKSAKARAAWAGMTTGQRRDFALFVAGAKQAETRERRLGGWSESDDFSLRSLRLCGDSLKHFSQRRKDRKEKTTAPTVGDR